jgi:uncharacterized membrane protein YphA (DoxX/SURF4 family)
MASALGKVSKWKDTIGLMQMHQVPWPTLALFIAILIEIVGGVCLLIGTFLYPTVIALFAYVVLVTAFIPFQDALKNQGRESAVPLIGSNIAILGSLVLVLALKGVLMSNV